MSDYTDFDRSWTQADNHQFRFQVMNDATGQVVDITGWLGFWLTFKRNVTDADPGVIQVSLVANANGAVTINNAPQGILQFDILPAATSALDRRRHILVGDIQGKDAASRVWTLARGQGEILPEVTRS